MCHSAAYMSLEGSSEFADFTIYHFCVKDSEEGQAVAISKSPLVLTSLVSTVIRKWDIKLKLPIFVSPNLTCDTDQGDQTDGDFQTNTGEAQLQ